MSEELMREVLEAQQGRFFGKYRGIVQDNFDKRRRGRLKIKVPQVLGNTEVWALPCVPYAGKDVGFFAMPDKGTGVWVEFEAGDPTYPIWTGCVWKEGDISAADADPSIKFFKTKKFTLRVDDSSGEIRIEDQSGSQIVITTTGMEIKSNEVNMESAGGRNVKVDAATVSVNQKALVIT